MKFWNSFRLGVFAIAVTTLSVTAVRAAPLDSSLFNHRYEGDVYNGSNPTLTGTGTSFTEFAGDGSVWAPSTDGDILTFQNTELDGGGYFLNDEWATDVDNSVGWTVEFRVQIGTDAVEAAEGAMQWFGKENGSSNTTRRAGILVGQSHVIINNVDVEADTNDNTDGFHVFRIAQPANSSNITVWRDEEQIYDGLSKTSNNSGVAMYFGDGSGGIGGPTITIDYFRWDSTGPYEPVPPATLTVDRRTGAMTLVNNESEALAIQGYSITSAAGSLDQSGWKPISSNYDVSTNGGDGSVDADDAWTILSESSSDTDLSEFQFGDAGGAGAGDGGQIGVGEDVVLSEGGAWVPSPDNMDLAMDLLDTQGSPLSVFIEYVGHFLGDMDGNGFIETADVNAFVQALADRAAYDSAYPGVDADLTGDFNNNGQLDLGDVSGFKAAVLAASASTSASASAVPEPSSCVLLLAAAIMGFTRRRG